jgi:MFS-type transporter involved in bile tolerance (Atg22 family)
VLYAREQRSCTYITKRQRPRGTGRGSPAAVRASAFNVDIFPGIIIIYLKACLLAALTLFVSTFATTNIFTIVVMAFVYFIGHLQAIAREYWLQEHSSGWITRVFLAS